MNVESIYLAKLGELKGKIETNASRFSGVTNVFSNMLESIESRMDVVRLGSTINSEILALQNSGIVSDLSDIVVKTNISSEIEYAIQSAAEKTGLDPNLIKGVIQNESSFHTDSVSGVGAQGLMQLMPATARELGVTDTSNVYQNVMGGATYLKKQLDRFGDIRLALAAYNSGPSRVASYNIVNVDDPTQYSRISSGVRGYVSKVLNYYAKFSELDA